MGDFLVYGVKAFFKFMIACMAFSRLAFFKIFGIFQDQDFCLFSRSRFLAFLIFFSILKIF